VADRLKLWSFTSAYLTAVATGIGRVRKKLSIKFFILAIKNFDLIRSSAGFKNTLGLNSCIFSTEMEKIVRRT
jgi:hypothetical protein